MGIKVKAEVKELRDKLKQGVMNHDEAMRMLAHDFPTRAKGPIATQITKAYKGQSKGKIPAPEVFVSGYTASMEYVQGWQSIKHFGLTGGPLGMMLSGKRRWPVKPVPYTISFMIKNQKTIGGSGSGIFLGQGSLHGHVYQRDGNTAKSPLKRYNVIGVPVMITNDAKEGISNKVKEIMEKRTKNALQNIFK